MNEVQDDESKREEHRQMSDLKGLFQRKGFVCITENAFTLFMIDLLMMVNDGLAN